MQQTEKWQRLKEILFYTFVFGLAAHAYMYFEYTPAHDAMQLKGTWPDGWQISLGRFLQPVYLRMCRGYIHAPWLVGALSLLYLGLAIYFILQTMEINGKWSCVLICAVYSTSLPLITSNASFINWSDIYMLALLCSSTGVYLLEKYRWGSAAAILLFVISMGLYQAYIFVAVGLLLIQGIKKIVEGEPLQCLMRRAGRYIAALLSAGVVYAVILRIVLLLAHVDLSDKGGSNSLRNLFENDAGSMLALIPGAYKRFVEFFARSSGLHDRAVQFCYAALALLGIALWVWYFSKAKIGSKEKILLAAAILLLPMGLNGIYVLANGKVYALMIFSYYLVFLLLFIPYEMVLAQVQDQDNAGKKQRLLRGYRLAIVLLCSYIAFHSTVYANGAYYYRQLTGYRTDLLMSRVLNDIAKTPGYTDGETPVAFLLDYKDSPLDGSWQGYERYDDLSGMSKSTINYDGPLVWYITDRYGFSMNLIRDSEQLAAIRENPKTENMTVYPQDGYCCMVDGVMVVKLSE